MSSPDSSPDDRLDETRVSCEPQRLAFCSAWKLDAGKLEIIDEFDTLLVDDFPYCVTPSQPVFLIVLWQGFSTEKAVLKIRPPHGDTLSVSLPPLKEGRWSQAQANSLEGFTFEFEGAYVFEVSSEAGSREKLFVIKKQ